jgi:hypothetical protein
MPTSHMGEDFTERIDLLQGTLDMLILRTLVFGPGTRTSDSETYPAHD